MRGLAGPVVTDQLVCYRLAGYAPGRQMRNNTPWAVLLTLVCATLLTLLFVAVAFHAPLAQPEAGGLSQKIFYFHVPAAYALYLVRHSVLHLQCRVFDSPNELEQRMGSGRRRMCRVFRTGCTHERARCGPRKPGAFIGLGTPG